MRRRDLILYVVIGTLLAAAVMLWPFVIPKRLWPHLTHAWFSLIFFTVLLGVVLARLYWQERRSAKLWFLLALLLVFHAMGYGFLLVRVGPWPALWYPLTMPIEVVVFAAIAKMWLNVLPRKGSL